jgi:hypothetical protein
MQQLEVAAKQKSWLILIGKACELCGRCLAATALFTERTLTRSSQGPALGIFSHSRLHKNIWCLD